MSYIQCCPACQSTHLTQLFDMGQQPQSLVQLTRDQEESIALRQHSIRIYICRNCTHVHNIDFNPNYVSYSQAGCRMYNSGAGWLEHVDKVRRIVEQIPDVHTKFGTIIEVGAGDCEFLHSINTGAVKIAIDPCEAVERATSLGFHYVRDYFQPDADLPVGDGSTAIIMRHLLEHMEDPRLLIESIVRNTTKLTGPIYLLIEVPCCQNALLRKRVEDWTYEHPQHFTVRSMMALLRACGIQVASCQTSYNGEVLLALAKIEPAAEHTPTVDSLVADFRTVNDSVDSASEWVMDNMDSIAFWGGGGKSAMLINKLCVPDGARVVDSHELKWGFCVPGTGIKMASPQTLIDDPVDYIIATASWRAEDVRDEIVRSDIPCKKLLKFENGQFVEVPLVQA